MSEMRLIRKPVRRVAIQVEAAVLREGSTGLPLHRVWAVADTASEAPVRTLALVKPPVPKMSAPAPADTGVAFEVAFYRKYTEALLRKYMKMRLESGRVPSMMGREMFRGKVTHYKVHGFDDVVIFCRDMEREMAKLNGLDRQLIRRIAMQGYTYAEVAGMVGVSLRSIVRRYAAALDRLTRMLIEVRLLEPQKSCQ